MLKISLERLQRHISGDRLSPDDLKRWRNEARTLDGEWVEKYCLKSGAKVKLRYWKSRFEYWAFSYNWGQDLKLLEK